jgi:two-component system response regulator MtrA
MARSGPTSGPVGLTSVGAGFLGSLGGLERPAIFPSQGVHQGGRLGRVCAVRLERRGSPLRLAPSGEDRGHRAMGLVDRGRRIHRAGSDLLAGRLGKLSLVRGSPEQAMGDVLDSFGKLDQARIARGNRPLLLLDRAECVEIAQKGVGRRPQRVGGVGHGSSAAPDAPRILWPRQWGPPGQVPSGAVDARILLVEDDPSIREVVALGLRAVGFDVDTAADGQAGLDRWRADRPDLVLLDVMLPRLDGLEVCRAIRRESTTPVVMLTARGDTIDVVVGLEAGADDYIRKPFEMPELIARVRAALRRRLREAELGITSDELRLGPLTIDLAGRTVARDGREIPLTRTEFDLLVELVRRPGQVFTRDVLLDRVWGYDYLGDSRLVDVAVGRLRAKIEADPAEPQLVLTVRGTGYKAARREG